MFYRQVRDCKTRGVVILLRPLNLKLEILTGFGGFRHGAKKINGAWLSLARALGSGPRGRAFKSHRPDV